MHIVKIWLHKKCSYYTTEYQCHSLWKCYVLTHFFNLSIFGQRLIRPTVKEYLYIQLGLVMMMPFIYDYNASVYWIYFFLVRWMAQINEDVMIKPFSFSSWFYQHFPRHDLRIDVSVTTTMWFNLYDLFYKLRI